MMYTRYSRVGNVQLSAVCLLDQTTSVDQRDHSDTHR